MKKIIFLILFFYSSVSFSVNDFGQDFYNSHLNEKLPCNYFPFLKQNVNSYSYTPKNNDVCTMLYFYNHPTPLYSFASVNVDGGQIGWWLDDNNSQFPPVLTSNFYYAAQYLSQSVTYKNFYACTAVARHFFDIDKDGFCLRGNMFGIDVPFVCPTPESMCSFMYKPYAEYTAWLVIRIDKKVVQPLVSEKTVKTENKLLAESNSKLGSIANSKSTESNFLHDIKNLFLSISSKTSNYILKQNCDTFGICDDSNGPTDFNDSVPALDSETVNLMAIPPLMSGSGSCPADISLTLLNQNYSISFQPICEFATRVRPAVIWSARVSAAWIVYGAL